MWTRHAHGGICQTASGRVVSPLVVGLMGCLLLGCPDIGPTNPYDPATPSAQQATGSIAGTISIDDPDENFDPRLVLPTARVRLHRAANAFDPFAVAVVDADGHFNFGDLFADDWAVVIELQGFTPATIPVELGIAEERRLAPVLLEPLDLDQPEVFATTATLNGRARLEGQRDHGSIRVEVPGWPYATVTTSDGDWSLVVPPGRYALRYIREGFGTQSSAEVAVAAGDELPLDDVVLPALPGSIVGRVALGAYAHPERLARASLELLDDRLQLVTSTSPSPDGDYAFDAVPVGAYTVRIGCPGYVTATLPAEAEADRRTRLGTTSLVHASDGPDAVRFSGRVRLDDAAQHSGTAVRVMLAPQGIEFTPVVTDADGEFSIPAARDEALTVTLQRPGYIVPLMPTTFRWQAEQAQFVGPNGPLDVMLSRQPIDGAITVPVEVGPGWLPERHRRVRVEVQGPGQPQSLHGVSPAEPARFTDLAAGIYQVTVSRDGFSTATRSVTLDAAQPAAEVLMTIELQDLADADLNLSGELLDACALRESLVDFSFADLSNVEFVGDLGAEPDCAGCVMCDAFDLHGADLSNADFEDATRFEGVRLSGARLSGATALDADFTAVSLDGASLVGARLDGAIFVDADLRDASLLAASLVDAIFVDTARDDVVVPCAHETRLLLDGARFAGADLTDALLSGVDWSTASLASATMSFVDASRSCLSGARLEGAVLRGSDLSRADLSRAGLAGADLTSARLGGARLTDAVLANAILEGAELAPPPGCRPHPFVGPDGQDYADRCAGAAGWRDVDCCRADLTRVSLSGANLVGADLRGVDAAHASLASAFAGELPGNAPEEPHRCRLEDFSLCADVFDRIVECGGGDRRLPVIDRAEFMEQCLTGHVPLQISGDLGFTIERIRRVGLECAASRVRADCGSPGPAPEELFSCLWDVGGRGEPAPPFDEYVPRCRWPDVLDGACVGPLPDACDRRPTNLSGARLAGARLSTSLLVGADLDQAVLTNAQLDGAVLSRSRLSAVDLSEMRIGDLSAPGASFMGSDLTGLQLADADLTGADLSGASLGGLSVERADLSLAVLDRTNSLDGPVVMDVVDLSNARLWDVSWPFCELTDADISGIEARSADLSRCYVVGVSNGAVRLLDSDLSGSQLVLRGRPILDLTGSHGTGLILGGIFDLIRAYQADLSRARFGYISANVVQLDGSVFEGAHFNNTRIERFEGRSAHGQSASFVSSRLADAHFTGSALSCAWFNGASLPGANFADADVRRAAFGSADLPRTRFAGADLSFADLRGADVSDAVFARAFLLRAVGFDAALAADLSHAIVCSEHRAAVRALSADRRTDISYVDCSLPMAQPDCESLRCEGDEPCGPSPIACYVDRQDRDLPLLLPGNEWLPDDCKHSCFERGHAFAGIQFGGFCFCGDDYGRHGAAGGEECLIPCRADPSQACGGDFRNLIMRSQL